MPVERAEITAKVTEVMEDVFDLDELHYRDDLSAADIDEWDSLTNIRFVVAVEKKFGVRFSNGEIAGLQNVGEMVDLLKTRLV
jgi:acyl carrier protein